MILNIIKITNKRIVDFIKDGNLIYFQNLTSKNISKVSKFQFLNDLEKTKISENFTKINLDKIRHRLDMFNIKYVTILDCNYPKRLKNIFNPPAILYYKGNLEYICNPIAVVGSRKASSYGIWATKKIIKELSVSKLTIVSGMALGIDRIAHVSALDNKLNSVGVLASSIDIQYPKSNIDLYARMKDQLLITESCLDVYPLRLNFVLRNRLISGLSLAVVVTEAGEKSGSLLTANYALEQGRDVFSLPGQINSIYSMGTNNLIKKGAKLVTCGDDILDEFSFLKEMDNLNLPEPILNVSKKSLEVIKNLEKKAYSVNDLSYKCDIEIDLLYNILIELEMKGIIIRISNGKYCLKK